MNSLGEIFVDWQLQFWQQGFTSFSSYMLMLLASAKHGHGEQGGWFWSLFEALILLFSYASLPGAAAKKHPHSMMLPPPSYIMGTMCLHLCAFFGSLKTEHSVY